jgi:uncharacterized membrane protein
MIEFIYAYAANLSRFFYYGAWLLAFAALIAAICLVVNWAEHVQTNRKEDLVNYEAARRFLRIILPILVVSIVLGAVPSVSTLKRVKTSLIKIEEMN